MRTFLVIISLMASTALIMPSQLANAQSPGNPIDLEPLILEYNDYFKKFRDLIHQLNNTSFRDSLSRWINQDRVSTTSNHARYIAGIDGIFKKNIHSPVLLEAFAYFVRTNQLNLASKTLELYYHQMYLFLRECSEDPRYAGDAGLKDQIAGYRNQLLAIDRVLAPIKDISQRELNENGWDSNLVQLDTNLVRAGGLLTVDPSKTWGGFLNLSAKERFDGFPGPWRPVSYSGFIPGNRVRYIQDTAYESAGKAYLNYISERLHLVPEHGYHAEETLKKVSDYKEDFKSGKDPFPSALFESIDTHPAFQESQNNIFYEVKNLIKSAKTTIFVDIFFLGGTVGVAIAEALIEKAESGVKVFIIRDHLNHFGHKKEMLPVMQMLRAYSETNAGKLIIVPAHTKNLPTGLPVFYDRTLNSNVLNQISSQLPSNVTNKIPGAFILSPTGKSDHSKVIFVDACYANEVNVAFVASKNWTDSSGAVTKDDAVRIEGPASCVYQNHYLHDMRIALLNDVYQSEIDASAMTKDQYIQHHFQFYASKNKLNNNAKLEEKIEAIISPFNPLSRPNYSSLIFPRKGDGIIRVGENNADGSSRSALDQFSQAILKAKRQILVRSLFLISRPVVNAIITAVKKNPELQVYIITDGFESIIPGAGMEGFPNWLYIDQLYALNDLDKTRVKVRFFRADFVHPQMSQEFHYKSLSVDGYTLNNQPLTPLGTTIIGSANWDPLTLFGAFREAQAEIFSPELQQKYDGSFWQTWQSNQVYDAIPWNFSLPAHLAEIDKSFFIRSLRQTVEPLYDIEIVNSLF